jgi:release factor glutamine methyltransferase
MNANSQQPTPKSIKSWLDNATTQLTDCGINSARLDAELILSDTLGQDRTFLHAHSDETLKPEVLSRAQTNLQLRIKRVPIAYISGQKEFYGRIFGVTTDTLIPRPESEDVIESLKRVVDDGIINLDKKPILVDIGTGCGILGITAKLEYPSFDVTLSDISAEALRVALSNANNLNADVDVIKGNLLENYDGKIDVTLANLPYVNPSWDRSEETNYEPASALFAADNGQKIIKDLLRKATKKIQPRGIIILEADPTQHKPLSEFAEQLNMQILFQLGYALVLQQH